MRESDFRQELMTTVRRLPDRVRADLSARDLGIRASAEEELIARIMAATFALRAAA